MTYDETLRLLDSWYGRPVLVSVQPDGSRWYTTTVTGPLPRRSDIDLEWLADDLPYASEGYSFGFADGDVRFQLVRLDFRDASLDDRGVLTIRLAGAEVTISRARRRP